MNRKWLAGTTKPRQRDSGCRSELLIRVVEDDHYAVVRVAGELDLATVPELRRTLAACVSCDIGLDVGDLEFIDASGLRVLASVADGCRRQGRRLVVLNPSDFMLRLFRICGLDRLTDT